jgi:hypothetical protein
LNEFTPEGKTKVSMTIIVVTLKTNKIKNKNIPPTRGKD